MENRILSSSTQLTIETGFLWECLLGLWLITQDQLNKALIFQKEYRENNNKTKTIWEILSELYSIPIEEIESSFVREQLIFWIKRLVKNILHEDKFLNRRIDNEKLPSLKDNFTEKNIIISIPYWQVNYISSLYFKQENWEIEQRRKPETNIESIEWLLELIINLNWEEIFHEKEFFYNVRDKKINISSMELMWMIRASFSNLYSRMSKNKSIQPKTIDYWMWSID
jgi:hypothetical protein